MVLRIRNLILLIVFAGCGWISWGAYGYFFDVSNPQVVISGLENDQYYCGDVQCRVSSNKSGEFSVFLDDKPLITQFKLSSSDKEHPFLVPTKTIANGKHTLKTELVDSTFHKNKTVIERAFFVDNNPLKAAFIKPDSIYKVFQGRTLRLQFQVNKPIKDAKTTALASDYRCFPESQNASIYECLIPIACEESPNEYLFSIEVTDFVGNKVHLDNKFQIVAYPFKKQVITLDKQKVKEEHEIGKSPREFEDKITELTQQSPTQKLWRGVFCTPIDIQRVTCEFGAIRTTQEKGRYMHKALDVINLPKSVVWAPQDGIVVLKDRFAESGNTVAIDHGMGVISMFFHLDEFSKIEPGQKITKGNPIGTLGKTGYATGYHLHWEMRINNIPVDPMQWTKANF